MIAYHHNINQIKVVENSNAGGGFETYNLIISGFSEN